MRILFILPADLTYHYKGSFIRNISYAPLTLTTLAALIPNNISIEDIKLNDEGVQKPIITGTFDIVAITCTTSAAPRAYELAHYWKNKGSYIVMGGVHPTFMPKEAAQHADTVMIGLGELTFPQFINDFVNHTPKQYYEHSNHTTQLSMPIPRRDLIKNAPYLNVPTVLANRGCQNRCHYCSIPALWGRGNLTRPINEVIDEIKQLNPKRIILLDPSPTSDELYFEELLREIAKLKIKWSGLSTIDVAHKPELFQLMIDSGCEGIFAGFETFSQANLKSMHKDTNIISRYKDAVFKFHQAGIPILGCFVAGFDKDTKESLLQSVDIIEEIGIDLPRFSILTPFPGTPLFDQFEKKQRILTKDWRQYDTMHVVFQPKNMTPLVLQQTFHQIWQELYSIKRIKHRLSLTKKDKPMKLLLNLGFKHYAKKLKNI